MRYTPLILGLALLFGGYGLSMLDTLAVAVASTGYRRQLQAFPAKQAYTRAELTDAVMQVWTNRIAALRRDTCDRQQFEQEIELASGRGRKQGSSVGAIGVLLMLCGSFVLGVSVQLRRHSGESNPSG